MIVEIFFQLLALLVSRVTKPVNWSVYSVLPGGAIARQQHHSRQAEVLLDLQRGSEPQ